MLKPRGQSCLLATLLACATPLSGCDSPLAQVAAVVAERPEGSDLIALEEGEATRIYYQFVDERGAVRFVESLELVPPQWRERVGFVESSTPPPMSPQDMKRAIQAQRVRLEVRASTGKRGPQIIMYSADWCGACRAAKKYMDEIGIEYEERNVDNESVAQEMRTKTGGRGIPVFDIDGAILKGFNAQRLEKMIQAAS
jgi:glutaredoxin